MAPIVQPEVARQRHFWRYVRNGANLKKIFIFDPIDFKFGFWAEFRMGSDDMLLSQAFGAKNDVMKFGVGTPQGV